MVLTVLINLSVFLLFLAMIGNKFLVLQKDFFLILYCCIALVYLMLIPSLAAFFENSNYLVTEYYSIIGFIFIVIPIVVTYKLFKIKNYNTLIAKISIRKNTYFLIFLFIFAILFLYITISSNILYRRIGHHGLANASLGMSLVELYSMRLFDEIATFYTLVIHFIYRHSDYRFSKISKMVFLFFILVVVVFFMINSRLQMMTLVLSHLILYVTYNKIKFKSFFFTALILFVVFWTVLLARSMHDVKEVNLSSLTEQTIKSSNVLERLNGNKILIDLHKEIEQKNFMLGASWKKPILLYYYLFFDREKYTELKKSMKTNSKVAIWEYYTGNSILDAPSSIQSDVYPNFGIPGLVIAGILLGLLIYLVSFGLNCTKSSFTYLVALYLIPQLLQFEVEFVSLILNIIKFSPGLFLLLIFKPFHIRRLN